MKGSVLFMYSWDLILFFVLNLMLECGVLSCHNIFQKQNPST